MSRLRIAITADPEIPVPPKLYGGIERIVDMLVRGLVERNHDVTLFAHPDSQVPCKLKPYPGQNSRSTGDLLKNMWYVSSNVIHRDHDIVHSFGRLAYLLPILPLKIPKLMSYQRAITARNVEWAQRLAGRSLHFSGCSYHLIQSYAGNPNWHTIYNGVPTSAYRFHEEIENDAPLVFLGRIEEIKGVHVAIEVAVRSGRSLIIAGNISPEEKHQVYFEEKIYPHIDGKSIRYIGPVNDAQKNEILGSALALLMPIRWEEPFGIVMAEALACGTPIIGFNRASVPEIVQDGINGYVCYSIEEMIEAVSRVSEIDRGECRRIAEERFSNRAIVEAYTVLYSQLIHELSV